MVEVPPSRDPEAEKMVRDPQRYFAAVRAQQAKADLAKQREEHRRMVQHRTYLVLYATSCGIVIGFGLALLLYVLVF